MIDHVDCDIASDSESNDDVKEDAEDPEVSYRLIICKLKLNHAT